MRVAREAGRPAPPAAKPSRRTKGAPVVGVGGVVVFGGAGGVPRLSLRRGGRGARSTSGAAWGGPGGEWRAVSQVSRRSEAGAGGVHRGGGVFAWPKREGASSRGRSW